MKVLAEAIDKEEILNGIDIKNQLLAKLGTNFDYLKNKSSKKASSGEPYHICGVAIVSRLLDKGLLIKAGDGYELGNTEACIKEIAGISQEILPLYIDDQSKPADTKNYIKALREKSGDGKLTELISNL